jgi:hypothetical protein
MAAWIDPCSGKNRDNAKISHYLEFNLLALCNLTWNFLASFGSRCRVRARAYDRQWAAAMVMVMAMAIGD